MRDRITDHSEQRGLFADSSEAESFNERAGVHLSRRGLHRASSGGVCPGASQPAGKKPRHQPVFAHTEDNVSARSAVSHTFDETGYVLHARNRHSELCQGSATRETIEDPTHIVRERLETVNAADYADPAFTRGNLQLIGEIVFEINPVGCTVEHITENSSPLALIAAPCTSIGGPPTRYDQLNAGQHLRKPGRIAAYRVERCGGKKIEPELHQVDAVAVTANIFPILFDCLPGQTETDQRLVLPKRSPLIVGSINVRVNKAVALEERTHSNRKSVVPELEDGTFTVLVDRRPKLVQNVAPRAVRR